MMDDGLKSCGKCKHIGIVSREVDNKVKITARCHIYPAREAVKLKNGNTISQYPIVMEKLFPLESGKTSFTIPDFDEEMWCSSFDYEGSVSPMTPLEESIYCVSNRISDLHSIIETRLDLPFKKHDDFKKDEDGNWYFDGVPISEQKLGESIRMNENIEKLLSYLVKGASEKEEYKK